MTSTPSSNRLEKWEIDTLAAIVEHEYERLRHDSFITKPTAWKRARYINLRADILADPETRAQLSEWRDRLTGPIGRRGTYAQRAEILRDLHREWSSTPNAQAYHRPRGDDLERLIDRCILERFGNAASFGATSDPQRRNPANRDGLTGLDLEVVFDRTAWLAANPEPE